MPEETVPTTVADAVNAAAKEHGLTETTEETSSENIETTKDEGTKDSETKDDDAQSQRTIRALNLLDQLEDVNSGPELVKMMAKQLGLLGKAETPREVAKAEKSLQTFKDRVVAKLGDDYPLLADSLGNIIDEFMTEQTRNFQSELTARDRAIYESNIDARIVRFTADNKVTEAEQAAITQLSSKFPPSPSVPVEDYLAHQLKVVRWEQAEKKEKTRTNSKIKENFAESPANRGVAGNEERIVKSSKNLTPLQAVQMAARGESVED